MKTLQPHIITEGAVQYQLGELKGNHIHYDFKKILVYLNEKGKLLFGTQFKIYEADEIMLFKLCIYFIKDYDYCKKLHIDPNKGILLSGTVGSGKTTLMKLLSHIVPHQEPYEVIPVRSIVFTFNTNGYSIIEHYGDSNFYCFDDLGIEPIGRHFGKDCNVMGEILLSRYDLFLKNKMKTHATTNLNAEELEENYGSRVHSRIQQLFNWIVFDKNTKDKRK